jgi:integrase
MGIFVGAHSTLKGPPRGVASQTAPSLVARVLRSEGLAGLPRALSREMRFLTAEQVHHLAQAMPEPYPTLVYVLGYGGLRWGEMAALRRSRCDILRSRLHVVESLADVDGTLYFGATKTYGSRSVALPPFLRDLLVEHLHRSVGAEGNEALVFTAPDGSPLRNSAFHKRFWTPAVRAAGLQGLRPHDLRHTAAALLIAQGAHYKAIQSHLGHSSITVTLDRYGHLFPDDQDRLADGLEKTYRDALAASPRPERGLEVVELPRASARR